VTHDDDDAHPRIDIFAQAKIFHNFQSLLQTTVFRVEARVKILPPRASERMYGRRESARAKEIKVKFPFLGCVYEWLYIPYLWKILEVHSNPISLYFSSFVQLFFLSFLVFMSLRKLLTLNYYTELVTTSL
jgi:hypothetical protein